jgi:hypothetical protein
MGCDERLQERLPGLDQLRGWGKCGDRCDPEDHRQDNAADAVNSYPPLLLPSVTVSEPGQFCTSLQSRNRSSRSAYKTGPSIAMALFQSRRVTGHWPTISGVTSCDWAR